MKGIYSVKEQLREKIKGDTEEYLKNGGEIKESGILIRDVEKVSYNGVWSAINAEDRRRKAVGLAKSGVGNDEIAEILDVDISTIRRYLRDY
jgi:ATP/maltotriose-dependent transcriptional regulator MalT